jgi:hypothetical protein
MSKLEIHGWRAAVLALAIGIGVAGSATAQVKAAQVRDVDRAAAQPVDGHCSGFSSGDNLTKCSLYTVPAGKRLVVETFSFHVDSDSTQSVYRLLLGKDTPQYGNILFGPGVYAISPGTPVIISGSKVYVGLQPLRFYMEEGDSLVAEVDYTGGSNYVQNFGFSGYLVDK